MFKLDSGIKRVILLVLGSKLILLAVPFISFHLFDFQNPAIYRSDNFTYPDGTITWKTSYKTWDANYYLYIADQGYHAGHSSNAFLPLYPAVIMLFKRLMGCSGEMAGMALSNTFSLMAFIFLFKLVEKIYDPHTAFQTVLYGLSFPTSFFFTRIYSESFVFLLIVLTFYFLYNRRYSWASFCAFLTPLTKGLGVFLTIPILVFFLDPSPRTKDPPVSGKWRWICVFSPFLGFVLSMFLMKMYTQNWFENFDAQYHFIAEPSVAKIVNVSRWFLDNFIYVPWSSYSATSNPLDRIFFVAFLVYLCRIFKSQSRVFFCYALFFGVVPALTASFMSYMRYLIVIFPFFIQMALGRSNHTRLQVLMFSCQLVLAGLHSLGYWVA